MNDMKETRTLEFKEQITNTFLKTVSAFANYGGGMIQFGIRDDGTIAGVADGKKACLDIENKINDSLNPVPDYTLQVNEETGVISLMVSEGRHKPYLYKSKAYKRNDTATIEVDRLELMRMILEAEHRTYDEIKAPRQELSFSVLEKKLAAAMHIQHLNQDILKTLELYTDQDGYNYAALLLADENHEVGADMVRFGETINIINDRQTSEHKSILLVFDDAIDMYSRYYQTERIEGTRRIKQESIPETAFREAMANAMVHREWDINAHIRVAMFEDRIEITSPGGLPAGISEAEYLQGQVSILRNPILAGVFFRLQLIERFGTGVQRIMEAYTESETKPVFDISANSIKVMLPVFSTEFTLGKDEKQVYTILQTKTCSSSEVVRLTGFGKNKTIKLLKTLLEAGYIYQTGSGRGTKYTVKR